MIISMGKEDQNEVYSGKNHDQYREGDIVALQKGGHYDFRLDKPERFFDQQRITDGPLDTAAADRAGRYPPIR